MPRKRRRVVIGIIVAAIFAYFGYRYLLPDRVLMWQTTTIDSGRASTRQATKAAKRFFDRQNFRGKSRDEIIAIAGDPKRSNDSIYNFPFYPIEPGVLLYRFDTGRSGWQFDIHFDSEGRATEVVHRGIE